ncbi:ribonuclease Z [Parafilimonas sp.]|uniref:ribonuclease Z n=1 Tax=Parafilimonas sp. TaxID=1969739 RepID=UPI0039E4906D
MFGVTILGNNSALPAYNRHPTAQVINLCDQLFLVDCGEGTQMQMNLYKIKRSRINHIFISHLHGDHYFGLPGLITSYGLLGRVADLHLYAPPPLKEILDRQLAVAGTVLPYMLYFHPLKEGTMADEEKFSVECFKVFHRIDCYGFLFREKRKPRKINIEAASKYNVPFELFDQLKEGNDIMLNKELIKNEELTVANKPPKAYAFCADTIYTESLSEKVKDVDLLYHEATYLKDKTEKAVSRFHSTSEQAAMLAKLSNAKKLLIGHFSSTYESLDSFLTEAQAVFPDTQLALEGQSFIV